MKSHTEYLWFNTKKHREFINITEDVEKALGKSQITEGLILVSAMHITGGRLCERRGRRSDRRYR